MTRPSRRELEREIESLGGGRLPFDDYCSFVREQLSGGDRQSPTEEEFFGRELTDEEHKRHYARLVKEATGGS